MAKRRKQQAQRDDREIVALFLAFCGSVVGYFVAEALLMPFSHVLHWLATFVAGVASYLGVMGWYSWQRPRTR